VTRILADHAKHTLAADDLALVANLLDAWAYLHIEPLSFSNLMVSNSLETALDASPGGVERRHLHHNAISRDDLDRNLSSDAAERRDDGAPVVTTDSVEPLREGLLYRAFRLSASRHSALSAP
jgi:hypothetical protein